MASKKTYVYKVYESVEDQSTGKVVKGIWNEEVISEPTFRWGINGSPQELRVRLARSYDSFGEDDDVKLNNDVSLECYDTDAANGVEIYRGFISQYRSVIEGHDEYVDIILQGYGFKLSHRYLQDSDGATTVAYLSWDPSDILKDIIDKQNAQGGKIGYSSTSIETTGTTVSYTFDLYSYNEAINKVAELCPEGWFWYIDTNNIIHLKQKSATADHAIMVGKDIVKVEGITDMEKITNRVFFVGEDPIYRRYDRDGSQSSYGMMAEKKVDHRVSVTATADTMSERILDREDTPELRMFLEIADNNGIDSDVGYDIESFDVGDTIRITNLKQPAKTQSLWDVMQWDVDVWDATLTYTLAAKSQIMNITYTPDKVFLETHVGIPEVSKRVEDINRNLDNYILKDVPSSPTVV